ncbi:ADP-ribosylation factor-binding protein GGA [Entomortierella parvispora]|uniref:ADP-ribosylation factor-binding protein GGA n=1 Tax=Entomortierella parvispora TaxID=205924 RepID=A0A9P3H388_9FUNG|nr:ADP-ribosylation factor-binding protein GGA [Entomortierella parvispora]
MNYGQPRRQKSVLEAYIERACDPTRYEPDMNLNLEICDVIKEKQQNTPREAAIYIARLVNHKNMHVGMLALTLLDNCVKNCGYPFHLQIATKEFLNSLVRRFPERPLTVPTPVQNRVLELIQEWYHTLCKTSRYKEDLIHIRDMHRLLAFKGYRFPPMKKSTAAVLNPVATLKSAAELEEEDRVAQAAKLQELIRRGRPEDVRAANELVKKMTGYEQEQKPDYAEQAAAELNKFMQKATLLTEMLNDVKPGEIIGRGDIFEELLGTCKAAKPRVESIITEDKDPDNMEKLLKLNEILNSVIEQYDEVKKGNLVKVALPSEEEDETNGGNNHARQAHSMSKQKSKETSLIDLIDDGSDGSNSSASTPKTTGNLMDDLLNLNFNDSPPPPAWGAAGSISLGQSSSALSSAPSTPTSATGGALPYNIFSSPITSVNPISVGSSSSTATNSNPAQSRQRSSLSQSATPSPPAVSPSLLTGQDEFEFVSNTGESPTESSEPTSAVLISKNGFQIDLDIHWKKEGGVNGEKQYAIMASFSNQLNSPLSALTLRVAVPKTLQLKLDPQSAQVVPAFSKRSVTQSMMIRCPPGYSGAPVRMRYHISYVHGGKTIEEQGEFSQFP